MQNAIRATTAHFSTREHTRPTQLTSKVMDIPLTQYSSPRRLYSGQYQPRRSGNLPAVIPTASRRDQEPDQKLTVFTHFKYGLHCISLHFIMSLPTDYIQEKITPFCHRTCCDELLYYGEQRLDSDIMQVLRENGKDSLFLALSYINCKETQEKLETLSMQFLNTFIKISGVYLAWHL